MIGFRLFAQSATNSTASIVAALIIIALLAFNGIVGYLIGNTKGRGTLGFWLGFLISIIGWIIVAVLPRTLELEEERELRLATARGVVSASPAPPSAAKATAEKIALLEELLENGLISDDEFEERKRAALDDL